MLVTNYHKLKEGWPTEKEYRQSYAETLRRAVKTKAQPIFNKFTILKAVLFGSVVTNNCNKNSDIDYW